MLLCFCLCMLAAACCDIRWRRLPNRLLVAVFGIGLLLQLFVSGVAGMQAAVGGALVGALVVGPFFWFDWLGGGDVKLAMAMGAWLGPQATLEATLGGFVGLLPMAVIWLVALRLVPERRQDEAWRYVPLGVPLALSAIWVGVVKGVLHA